jgi:hypothetical protein
LAKGPARLGRFAQGGAKGSARRGRLARAQAKCPGRFGRFGAWWFGRIRFADRALLGAATAAPHRARLFGRWEAFLRGGFAGAAEKAVSAVPVTIPCALDSGRFVFRRGAGVGRDT